MERYIPPSERNPALTSQSKKKFKYNILNKLNNKIKANIKYNNDLNSTLKATKTYTSISPNDIEETSNTNTPISPPKTIPNALSIQKKIPQNRISTFQVSQNHQTSVDTASIKPPSQQTHPKIGTISTKSQVQQIHPISDGDNQHITSNPIGKKLTATLDKKSRGNNNIDNTDENINKNANKIGGTYSKTPNKQLLNGIHTEIRSNKIVHSILVHTNTHSNITHTEDENLAHQNDKETNSNNTNVTPATQHSDIIHTERTKCDALSIAKTLPNDAETVFYNYYNVSTHFIQTLTFCY